VIEQVEYDPYGRVRRTALGDFDHDGAIATADIFANLAAFNAPSPAADHDWSGTVAVADIFAFHAHWFAADATPRDQLSSSGNDNPIGYCGYYHDRETVGIMGERNGGLYQVRHRVYDPHAGRWLQRDPAGFVDGMNLYEYVAGRAALATDPTGEVGIIGAAVGGLVGGVVGGLVAIWTGDSVLTGIVGGAAGGAFIGSGAGLIAAVVTGAASGLIGDFAGQVTDNYINDRDLLDLDPTKLVIATVTGGLTAGIFNKLAKLAAFIKKTNTYQVVTGRISDWLRGLWRGMLFRLAGDAGEEVAEAAGKSTGSRTAEQAGISPPRILRIQNAADRIGEDIHVVGSRASGTAREGLSDWDYIVNTNARKWGKIKNSLPGAGEMVDSPFGLRPGLERLPRQLRPEEPHVTFKPRKHGCSGG
jgi:RHS repeat-associated protein